LILYTYDTQRNTYLSTKEIKQSFCLKKYIKKGQIYITFQRDGAKIFQNKNTFFQLKTNKTPTETKYITT